MLTILDSGRRRLLQIGACGLGSLALPRFLGAQSGPAKARAKACILLYMDGGASHIDLWDMKPRAPDDVRGPWKPIATSTSGVQISELLPKTAQQMKHLTIIRSMRHTETVHDPAVYQMLTGVKHISSAGDLKVDDSDFPQLGTAFGRVDRRPAVMPRIIELPETMKMEARVLPGQNAGFLGRTWDPFRVSVSREGLVTPPDVARQVELPTERIARRATLLERFNGELNRLQSTRDLGNFNRFQEQALAILEQPGVRKAFEIDRETPQMRERYGLCRHGQSVLLARRLVEAGARFVTVYWGREDQDWADGKGLRPANNPWDTHRNHFPLVQGSLAPRADQALAALVSDLHERGMLAETLVVWSGDFGRTPKISKPWASRDHWPHAFSVVCAGGGMPGGAVYGATDRLGAEVIDKPVSPPDLTATIYAALGVDPSTTIEDTRGRQHALSTGRPIELLA
jgi:hypothetical protein